MSFDSEKVHAIASQLALNPSQRAQLQEALRPHTSAAPRSISVAEVKAAATGERSVWSALSPISAAELNPVNIPRLNALKGSLRHFGYTLEPVKIVDPVALDKCFASRNTPHDVDLKWTFKTEMRALSLLPPLAASLNLFGPRPHLAWPRPLVTFISSGPLRAG